MDERITNLEKQLKTIAAEIETLEINFVGSDFSHLLFRLKGRYIVAVEKLRELKEAGDHYCEHFKSDIWIAWYELDTALRDIHEVTLPRKELSVKQMKRAEPNESPQPKQSGVVVFPCGGKRISTPTDMLTKKNWIALNTSKIELINAMRSCRPVKPTVASGIEKDKTTK